MDGVQPPDEDVVAQVGNGDPEALSVLYDRYSKVVYSLILRVIGNRQVAEELTQEVFLRVWRQAGTFHREKGRFASWILGIAHHIAIDEIRRRKARPQQVYESGDQVRSMLDVADYSAEPSDLALGGLRREYIVEAVAQLPINQREVIELSYFGGLTQTQIAERTGEPLGTIKTRTRLALQRLRANLTSQGMRSDTI